MFQSHTLATPTKYPNYVWQMATGLLQSGELFEGRFRIDKQIGEGGFSKVYSAQDEQTGEVVALKVLVSLSEVPGGSKVQGDLADRFLREARILTQLVSPNSIRLLQHGQTSQGVLFMAFEFIKGPSLFETIRDNGAQSAEFLVHVLKGTLSSLEDAHLQGLLHRDVKPNNIMLATQPEGDSVIKVLDFGIAKAYGEAAGLVPGNDLTAAGTIVGTPRYMPPEQLRGKALTPGSDIYSLGIVCIEVLTGQKAIKGKDRMLVIQQQISPQPIPLPATVVIPPRLRQIIERMVFKDPALRYQNASEVLADLKDWKATPKASEAEQSAREDRTIATTINIADLHATPEDATVLQTVNSADLSRAMAAAQQNGGDLESTLSAPQLSADLANDLMPTNERAALAPPTNWPPPSLAASNRSANLPISNGSGTFQASAQSGQFNVQQGTPDTGWDTSGQQSLSARQEFEVSQSQSLTTPTFELTSNQKAILACSFFLPGLAHIMFGKTTRGIVYLAVFILTAGVAIIGSLAVVFDAYLTLRAQGYREVGEWEFFPDYKSFFS